MPELPEVETVRRELEKYIAGKQIVDTLVLWPKTFVHQASAKLNGQTIRKLTRKGKYLTLVLDKGDLVIHLRMTGQLLFIESGTKKVDPYSRMQFVFEDGSNLIFSDKRKFGRIYYVDQAKTITDKIGIDAISKELDKATFSQLLLLSKMRIKPFLLSQRYISGLGNIYVDESLFRAGIHPASAARAIDADAKEKLFKVIIEILSFAIKNMGSTISDYRDPNGNIGQFQDFFNVYQQTGKPCLRCDEPIQKIKLGGRGTHFCPKCQKVYI